MAYVDKFNIDDNSYYVKDTDGRAETAKKIDIDTTGDLNQTVTKEWNMTAGTAHIKSNNINIEFDSTDSSRNIIKTGSNITEPIEVGDIQGGVKLGGQLRTGNIY